MSFRGGNIYASLVQTAPVTSFLCSVLQGIDSIPKYIKRFVLKLWKHSLSSAKKVENQREVWLNYQLWPQILECFLLHCFQLWQGNKYFLFSLHTVFSLSSAINVMSVSHLTLNIRKVKAQENNEIQGQKYFCLTTENRKGSFCLDKAATGSGPYLLWCTYSCSCHESVFSAHLPCHT